MTKATTGAADGRCLFELLPVEMLSRVLAILAHLDWETLLKAAPAVCRKWRAVCRDLVPAVFKLPPQLRVGDGVLRAIGTRFRAARGVSLGWCSLDHRATSGAVRELATQCRQLRLLGLKSVRLDVTQLIAAVQAVPNLRVLE